MDELSKKWKDLSDIQQATIIELVAGKHQGNVFSSLMANFDTARAALETSLNSSGSAMKEHAKWSKSLEARLNKLKAAWQSLSQSFMKSDFLKGALDVIISLIDGVTELIDKIGVLPTLMGAFAGFKILKVFSAINKFGGLSKITSLPRMLVVLRKEFPATTAAAVRFSKALKKVESSGNNAAGGLSKFLGVIKGHPYITAAVVAVTALTAAFTIGYINQKKKAEELAKKVEELTSEYKEQHAELSKLQGNYDADDESSMINRYAKLSRGVDNLGRNVSLTADEYSEYQNIVNQIAEQIPSLVSGYDSQGNALLSCKDNVEELTAAYEKLIHSQNQKILTNTSEIEENYENFSKDHKKSDKTFDVLQEIVNGGLSEEEIISRLMSLQHLDISALMSIFEKAGIKTPPINARTGLPELARWIKEAVGSDPAKFKGIIDNYYEEFTEVVEQQKSIAKAKLSEAFDVSSVISGLDYGNISEDLQSVAYQVVNSLDKDFFDKLQKNGQSVEGWVTEMLNQLNSIGKDDRGVIEAGFDLQTKFNGGEISYGEYIDGLNDVENVLRGLRISDEVKAQIRFSLGLDEKGIVKEYQQLRNRLADNELFDIMPSEYEPFLDKLSAEELSVLIDIIPELSETEYRETIEDIDSLLKKEMMLRGLTFDLNLEVESAGIEALNTALTESVSATGLSSESIKALKGRYADLEMQGYDLSSMFEETSTGIRLNRQEFNKLENAYATQKLADIDSDLTEMKITYDDLGEAIKNCDDPIKKSELFNDRQTLAKRISEAATLAHQYKGLTNAYNDWLSAESAGQERDMYENIIKGFETVDDEISRGWIDDSAIEFLELLTGRTDLAGKSGKQLKEIYDGLDESIKYLGKDGKVIEDTGYSIRDFFTVDEDGNSTNTGVYNFLDAIGRLEEEAFNGKDVVKRDKDGNIIGFDFELAGGDEVIAEALGVSEELVQIMVRAADDAGFVVSMDGTYRQLADLQNEAKAAADYLHEIGKTDFEFDFNTTSVENLKNQLEEAHKILDSKEFWNKDGTFNFNADGATQAMQVVSTLQAKLDNLTSEKYGIGLTVEDEEFEEPLENLQEYGRNVATLNQLKLNPEANAEEIEELNAKLDKSAKYFAELDNEKKVQIGLVTENGKAAFTEEYFDSLSKEKKIEIGLVNDKGEPITDYIDAVQKKIENGEIKIPTVLDIQANMDKNIETLADLALLNSGLLSDDEEEVIKKKYSIDVEVEANEVDTSDVDSKVDDSISREDGIKIIAETVGIEDVDDLSTKLKGLDDKTIQAVAEVIGQIDVDNLKLTMATLGAKDKIAIDIIAKAMGEGDVEKLKFGIDMLSPKTVEAIAKALGYGGVEELKTSVASMDGNTVKAVAEALGIKDVNRLQTAIDNMKGNEVDAKVNTDGQAAKISTLQSVINGLKGKTVDIVTNIKKVFSTVAAGGKSKAAQRTGADPAGNDSDVNGTANVNGTTGRAFKQGSWRTKKAETALTGELGREIVVTPQNRWYTVGDNGAEFVNIPRGSIVFNHRQTEELLKNGKATSDGGRAKALVNGTAFSMGSGGIGRVVTVDLKKATTTTKTTTKKKTIKETTEEDTTTTTTTTTGSDGKGGGLEANSSTKSTSSTSSSSGSSSEKFEETIDWIEVAINRIERAIDQLDQKANNVYKSWSSRNSALTDEIGKVGDEIELQQQAYDRYIKEANSVGLDESYAKKVRDGTIDIEDFEGKGDEALVEKIKDYQEWYEKALDCQDAILELKETESKLYAQRFEHIQAQYDSILQGYEHTEVMLNEYISQAEEKGYVVSKKYYQALINNEKANIDELKREQADLIAMRDEAVDSGAIVKGSQAWYEQCAEIDSVTQAIEESTTALLEYDNAMRDIDWQIFDLIQERISDVTEEADFLIELMSNKKLFEDNGKLTSQGLATMGLHAQNYNTHMYAADEYGAEVAKLDKQIAKDPYDQTLIERRNELLELQRESILAAEDEKNAIRDMVEEGIGLELDALQELIDKKNEELESEKDLYEYQKKVKEQTSEIASLEKQMAAYSGDDSEEARMKIQELKVSLEEAESELQETEWDRYISDQSQLLDELYLEYETILNTRLDNIDALLSEVIASINSVAGVDGSITSALGNDGAIAIALSNNATSIKETLADEAGKVGTTLSDAMKNIWNTGDGNAKSVLDMYGKSFQSKQTTTNAVLNDIKASINRMVDDVDKDAQKKVETPKTKPSSVADPTKGNKGNNSNNGNKQPSKSTVTDDTIKGIATAIWIYGKDSGWGNNPFRENKLSNKIGAANAKKVQDYINKHGSNGDLYKFWTQSGKNLNKYKYNAFRTGAKDIDATQLAWTQENGKEFIVRPSDGAILTPVARGDSILTSAASNNIWDMANSPAEFIKNNLGIGDANVPNNSSVQNSYVQHFENVTFSLPNVHSYNELLREMQEDPKFEKLVLAMTVDQIAGKSKLAKGKVIRK